ncbi:MAG: MerR family transcriptional regulator [Pseudomonadota bacterium]
MNKSAQYLNPSAAAKRLGVSVKALRLYEKHGLVTPTRTSSGWRTYGPDAMARLVQIVALRAVGLSITDVGRVLGGDAQTLKTVLAQHHEALQNEIGRLVETALRLQAMRAGAEDRRIGLTHTTKQFSGIRTARAVGLDLPWPWGGEHFLLSDVQPLTYITGPLGSGKTRLAMAIADTLPDARFVGLDRLDVLPDWVATHRLSDTGFNDRVNRTIQNLVDDGADATEALRALVFCIEARGETILVIDLIEQGLSEASQTALIRELRHKAAFDHPLFVMTRSDVILDMQAVGPDEAVILCPANHSSPRFVAPYPGAAGYEAAATCLAPPQVRARTEGVIAMRPQ